ncbi:hypothetical protein SO802_030203 [Lithocarpus litseifolius]|uniref:Uncharacterized protein n=1 Tax=Lithocarpus litseifolius TaxID=425828 RepID=A0AAW2BJF3_9ROSI
MGLSATSSCGPADLTSLFQIASHEAKKSRAQNRIFRVILIYFRSSAKPHHQWPINRKLFTLDVIYLHDKPGPDNCPQEVYDALVESLEHVNGYLGCGSELMAGVVMAVVDQRRSRWCDLGVISVPTTRCWGAISVVQRDLGGGGGMIWAGRPELGVRLGVELRLVRGLELK